MACIFKESVFIICFIFCKKIFSSLKFLAKLNPLGEILFKFLLLPWKMVSIVNLSLELFSFVKSLWILSRVIIQVRTRIKLLHLARKFRMFWILKYWVKIIRIVFLVCLHRLMVHFFQNIRWLRGSFHYKWRRVNAHSWWSNGW